MKSFLFLTAYFEEANSVLKFFNSQRLLDKKISETVINQKRVLHLEMGMGCQNVQYSLKKLLVTETQFERIYIVGFCGGLSPNLKTGQIITAQNVVLLKNKVQREFFLRPEEGRDKIQKVLTVDRIIKTPDEKKRLFLDYHVDAVDMETGFVLEFFEVRRVSAPVTFIKSVIDTSDQEIPQNLRGSFVEEKNLLAELKNNMKISKERLEKEFLEPFFDSLCEEK